MKPLRHECQPNSHGLCDVRHVDAGGRRRHCWGATTRTGVVFLQAWLSINPLWVLGAEKCAQKAPKSVTFSGSAYSVKEPRHGGKCPVRHVRGGGGGT